MGIEFTSELKQAEGVNATGIPVPEDVVTGLGGAKNAKVTASVRRAGTDDAWYTYPISIGSRNGVSLLSFSAAHRQASGLVAGDRIDVTVELLPAP